MQSLCHISPSWGFLSGGAQVTLTGWDFQPKRRLKVLLGGNSLSVTYRDTCTAVLTLPSVTAERQISSQSSINRRDVSPLAIGSGSFGLQLFDEANVDFASTPIPFQMKSPVPSFLGIVVGCASPALCPFSNYTALDNDDSLPCPYDAGDMSTIPKRCFKTSPLIHIGEMLIVLKDSGGGDLYEEHGFDPNHATEVDIELVMFPPKTESRSVHRVGDHLVMKQCDEIRGFNCTGSPLNGTIKAWTESGILRIQDFSITYPVTGTYTLNFTTNVKNKNGNVIQSGAIRLKVGVNVPYSFGFSTSPPTTSDGKTPLAPAPVLEIKDISGNPLARDDLPETIEVGITLEAYELMGLSGRERRFVSQIPVTDRWETKVYREPTRGDQIIATGVPSSPGEKTTLLTDGSSNCVATCAPGEVACVGTGLCWLPHFSFLPQDLGGKPLYSKISSNRISDSPFDPPFHDGGNSQLSVVQAAITVAAAADFKGLIVSDVWHGVIYKLTYTLRQPHYAAYLLSVSHNLTRVTCPPVGGLTYFALNFSTHCLPCPAGGVCDGTVFIQAKTGFWRHSENSIQFYACKAANCDRADRRLAGDALCQNGTMGPLCAVCRPNWGRTGDTCTACPELIVSILIITGMTLATLVVITIMVKSNLDSGGKQKSRLSIIFKILMNYLQTATLMKEFQTRIKALLNEVLEIQEASSGPNPGGFGCAMGWNQYQLFQMWMIVPLFVFVLPGFIALVIAFKSYLMKKKTMHTLKNTRSRRYSIGLDAEDEEEQIAQMFAIQTGKPVPSFGKLRDRAKLASPSDSIRESPSKKPDDEQDDYVEQDDEYITDKNVYNANRMQDGWGDHDEVSQNQKTVRINEYKRVKEMQERADKLAAEETDAAIEVLKSGTEAEKNELKKNIESVLYHPETQQRLQEYDLKIKELKENPPGDETEWVQKTSKRYGRMYWKSRTTGESTWTKPESVAKIDEWEVAKQEVEAEREALLSAVPDIESPRDNNLEIEQQPTGDQSLMERIRAAVTGTSTDPQDLLPVDQNISNSQVDEDLDEAIVDEGINFDDRNISQVLNPGERAEVKDDLLHSWALGTVISLEINIDGIYEALVDVPNPDVEARAELPSILKKWNYIREPIGAPVRTAEDNRSYCRLYQIDSCYRLAARDAMEDKKRWKCNMSWKQRLTKAREVEKYHIEQDAENERRLEELQDKALHSDIAGEVRELSASIKKLEEEMQAHKHFSQTSRLPHRRRWARIQKQIEQTVASAREAKLTTEAGGGLLKTNFKDAQTLLRAAEVLHHISPGTGECRQIIGSTESICYITRIEIKIGGLIMLHLDAVGGGLIPLPKFEGSKLVVGGREAEQLEFDMTDSSAQSMKGSVLFKSAIEITRGMKLKFTYSEHGDWSTFKAKTEDQYEDGARPDEGLFKCTICRTDFAIVACDSCGEEREPHKPWSDRVAPFYQPAGTRSKHQERIKQLGTKRKGNESLPLISGELMCQVCHRVMHTEKEKTGPRYHHLKARHDDTKHKSIIGKKVLRKIIITQEEPEYDVTTLAGRVRYKKERGQGVKEVYIVTVLVIIFLAYPRLMTEIATLMKCERIADLHESYLSIDMKLSCDTTEYSKWRFLAVVFLLAYGVGIPVAGGVVCVFFSRL